MKALYISIIFILTFCNSIKSGNVFRKQKDNTDYVCIEDLSNLAEIEEDNVIENIRNQLKQILKKLKKFSEEKGINLNPELSKNYNSAKESILDLNIKITNIELETLIYLSNKLDISNSDQVNAAYLEQITKILSKDSFSPLTMYVGLLGTFLGIAVATAICSIVS